jgi:hypothetical protein
VKLTVGQTLWFVAESWNGKPQGRDVTVTKVGRLWFEHDGSAARFDVKTLRHENGRGQCWLSGAAHAVHKERIREWRRISEFLDSRNPPGDVSLHSLKQAALLLGVPTEKP